MAAKEFTVTLDAASLDRVMASLRLSISSCERLAKREGQQVGAASAYKDEAHELRLLLGIFTRLQGKV